MLITGVALRVPSTQGAQQWLTEHQSVHATSIALNINATLSTGKAPMVEFGLGFKVKTIWLPGSFCSVARSMMQVAIGSGHIPRSFQHPAINRPPLTTKNLSFRVWQQGKASGSLDYSKSSTQSLFC